MTRDHRDCLTLEVNRNGLFLNQDIADHLGLGVANNRTSRKGLINTSILTPGEFLADYILCKDSRRGRRANMCNSDVTFRPALVILATRHPENQVGERDIGEQLPLGDQLRETLAILNGQRGMRIGKITS